MEPAANPRRPGLPAAPAPHASRGATLSLLAGPLLAALAWWALGGGAPGAAALEPAGRTTAALAVWMAVWWLTEAIPIPATALLPLVVLPLAGASPIRAAAAPYAHELLFLFLGGFVLALGLQRWGLDRRLALATLALVGASAEGVVAAFMGVTALLSMWVSNTATAILMLSIALGVLRAVDEAERRQALPRERRAQLDRFAVCVLLGIAYGASIGGVATLVGTPPNLFLASYAEGTLDREIGFARWLAIGLPFAAGLLPFTWWLLVRRLFPIRGLRVEAGAAFAARERARLGPWRWPERATAAVFATTALAWITRPLLVRAELAGMHPLAGLTDPGIAVAAALALFVIPAERSPDGERRFLMDWETASGLPWGILLLFGGGLSLAAALRDHGVSAWLGSHVAGLEGLPPVLVVGAVVALVIFLTELTSNTATAATLVPILGGVAPGLGVDPLLLAAPAAMAASCAFMLPVATPPNAIVFGSGRMDVRAMRRAGGWLNLAGVVWITAIALLLVAPVLGAAAGIEP